jgi:hypothetical protein
MHLLIRHGMTELKKLSVVCTWAVKMHETFWSEIIKVLADGTPDHWWKNSTIKIDFREMKYELLDWIQVDGIEFGSGLT